MKITRDALAGAFLLNVVHKPSIWRLLEYDVARYKDSYLYSTQKEVIRRDLKKHILDSDSIWNPVIVETELFFFDGDKSK